MPAVHSSDGNIEFVSGYVAAYFFTVVLEVGRLRLFSVVYGCSCSYTIVYDLLRSYTVVYGRVPLHTVAYGRLRLFLVVYGGL